MSTDPNGLEPDGLEPSAPATSAVPAERVSPVTSSQAGGAHAAGPRRDAGSLRRMPAVKAISHTSLPDDDPSLPEMPSQFASADAMGATAVAYLVTGPALFGGIGAGLDHWLGTGFATLVGVLVGMALSVYLIWFRYGST